MAAKPKPMTLRHALAELVKTPLAFDRLHLTGLALLLCLLLFSTAAVQALIAGGQELLAMASLALAVLAAACFLLPGDAEIDKPPERDGDYRKHAPALYVKQGGYGGQRAACAGCRERYLEKDFEVDHIHPKAKGGGDEIENLQLLCAKCNRRKSDGTMAELREKLRADGTLSP